MTAYTESQIEQMWKGSNPLPERCSSWDCSWSNTATNLTIVREISVLFNNASLSYTSINFWISLRSQLFTFYLYLENNRTIICIQANSIIYYSAEPYNQVMQ